MEIGTSKEGRFKSEQGHVRSGYKGRKENEGCVFLLPQINVSFVLLVVDIIIPSCTKQSDVLLMGILQ